MESKKTSWKCGICGKEYSTIEERIKCEQNCKNDLDALHKQSEIAKLKDEIENQEKERCALWKQYCYADMKYSDLKKRLYKLENKAKPTIKGFVNGKELANEAYKVLSVNESYYKVLRNIFGI